MRRIGLCFGNFDPIFTEMVELCEDVLGEFGLDYILLAPYATTYKLDEQLNAYIEHRKDMIRLATWGNNKIGLADFDVPTSDLRCLSELINKIQAKHNAEVFNIISSQFFLELQKHEGFEEFLRDRNFIVAMLPHFSSGVTQVSNKLSSQLNCKIFFSTSTKAYLSSAIIRAYVQLGVAGERHLPVSVLEYINKNFLYKAHSGLFERVRDLEPEPIYKHTVATCLNAIEIAQMMNVSHNDAIIAALLHNIGKCYTAQDLRRQNVYVPDSVDRADPLTRHGRLGEIAARYFMGITNPNILQAIKHHSTGKPNMSKLTRLLFVAATLAHEHESEDYKHIKYQFFNAPDKMFFQLLSSKYKRAKAEYPMFDFPTALKRCYRYYKDPKRCADLFVQQGEE